MPLVPILNEIIQITPFYLPPLSFQINFNNILSFTPTSISFKYFL